MLDVSPGPYRNDFDAQIQRTEAVSQELAETQESLALERAENKILRAENIRLRGRFGVSKLGLLFLGVFRWGIKPIIAMIFGMAVMGIVMTVPRGHSEEPRFRPEPRPHRVSRPVHQPRPTMIVPLYYDSCHQAPIWTWGGENTILVITRY